MAQEEALNKRGKSSLLTLTGCKDLSGKHPVSALLELCTRRRWGPPSFSQVKMITCQYEFVVEILSTSNQYLINHNIFLSGFWVRAFSQKAIYFQGKLVIMESLYFDWMPIIFYTVKCQNLASNEHFYLLQVVVNGENYQPSIASDNKKKAKADAATAALQQMGLLERDPNNPL